MMKLTNNTRGMENEPKASNNYLSLLALTTIMFTPLSSHATSVDMDYYSHVYSISVTSDSETFSFNVNSTNGHGVKLKDGNASTYCTGEESPLTCTLPAGKTLTGKIYHHYYLQENFWNKTEGFIAGSQIVVSGSTVYQVDGHNDVNSWTPSCKYASDYFTKQQSPSTDSLTGLTVNNVYFTVDSSSYDGCD